MKGLDYAIVLALLPMLYIGIEDAAAVRSVTFDFPYHSHGDCIIFNQHMVLTDDHRMIWTSDVESTGGSDSWGIKGLTLYDVHHVPLYTFPDFWSPTISHNVIRFDHTAFYPVNISLDDIAYAVIRDNHC
jgi:hypothetical protein